MKKLVLFSVIFICITLLSCGQKKEVTYKQYSCPNKDYYIEIPSAATVNNQGADFMSFIDDKTHLMVTVSKVDYVDINDYINNVNLQKETFTYDIFRSTDSTVFYKVTRGNNMWAAYELYYLRKKGGFNYLIKLSSDIIGKSEMIEIGNHICNSLK